METVFHMAQRTPWLSTGSDVLMASMIVLRQYIKRRSASDAALLVYGSNNP